MIRSLVSDVGKSVGKAITGIGGFSWAAYWATRTLSDLILTVDSDTQITLDWTNNGTQDYAISIERSTDSGVTYSEIDTVAAGVATYVNDSLTANIEYYYRLRGLKNASYSDYCDYEREVTYATVILSQTAEVNDTVTLLDFLDGATITKNGSNLISKWANKLGVVDGDFTASGTESKRPLISDKGIYFDGDDDWLYCNIPDIAQPFEMFIIFKTYTGSPTYVMCSNTFRMMFNGGHLKIAANTFGCTNGDLEDYYNQSIVHAVFNDTNSSLAQDEGTPVTGSIGANGAASIVIGSYRTRSTGFSELEIKSILIRSNLSSAQDRIDIYRYLKLRQFPQFDGPKILFTSDGNTVTNMYDALIAKGVKGTFYIPVDLMTNTWEELVTYHNAGMDIQCHSKTNSSEDTLTQEELVAEMLYVNNAFTANGLPSPQHHAYPSGDYNADVIEWIAPYRLTGRTIGSTTTDDYASFQEQFKNAPHYEIRTENIDYCSAAELVALKTKIDLAVKWNGVIILYTNGVGEDDYPGNSNIKRADFDAIVDYAVAEGMDVITISELYALLD